MEFFVEQYHNRRQYQGKDSQSLGEKIAKLMHNPIVWHLQSAKGFFELTAIDFVNDSKYQCSPLSIENFSQKNMNC